MNGIRTILHPTDFSESSRYAFETACVLAREYDATLLVLHVMVPSVSPLGPGPPDPLRPIESQESLAHLPWPEAPDPRLRVEHRLTEGNPAEEVLRLVEPLGCDLIVMGSRGRTGIGRLLIGSVAEEVLRKAGRPVLIVKTPWREAPEPAPIAACGVPVDVRTIGAAPLTACARTFLRTSNVEVVRLLLRAGQDVSRHAGQGEVLLHCLEGRVSLAALGKTQELPAGSLIDLPADEPYTIHGIEDASLLLTVLPRGK